MTVSFMFCALVASYGVRMVGAVLVNNSGQSPLTLTHLIHEYHVDIPWIGVHSRGFCSATLVAKF
jgi:hypothetical protein